MNTGTIGVLLIENDPTDTHLIREALAKTRGATFRLWRADQLDTGLQLLAKGEVNVVLLDLELPDSQGLDMFIRLREQAPDVPVVVLSALDNDSSAKKGTTARGAGLSGKGAT